MTIYLFDENGKLDKELSDNDIDQILMEEVEDVDIFANIAENLRDVIKDKNKKTGKTHPENNGSDKVAEVLKN